MLAEIMKHPPQSVLMLVDVEGMVIGPRELELFEQTSLKCQPVLWKTAVLGGSGARKVMLDIVIGFSKLHAKVFEERE